MLLALLENVLNGQENKTNLDIFCLRTRWKRDLPSFIDEFNKCQSCILLNRVLPFLRINGIFITFFLYIPFYSKQYYYNKKKNRSGNVNLLFLDILSDHHCKKILHSSSCMRLTFVTIVFCI